jgi:hypothetical protein
MMASIGAAQMFVKRNPFTGVDNYHNILVFRDDNGVAFAEMNGGPVEKGNIIGKRGQSGFSWRRPVADAQASGENKQYNGA